MDNPGRISKAGDGDVRAALYSAANAMMMRSIAGSDIKSWGLRLMKRKGRRRAVVAVARKLAVVMHRMWADNTEFHQRPLEGSVLAKQKLKRSMMGSSLYRTRSVGDAENGCCASRSARLSWVLHNRSDTCVQRSNRTGPIMTAKRSLTRMRDNDPLQCGNYDDDLDLTQAPD
jgi:hypothetical protein